MLDALTSTFRIMRSFTRRDSAERIRAMREHAAADPQGTLAPWMAAIALWEEGELEEANRLAEVILEQEPDDFRMLVICLDRSIRRNDPEHILTFAQRVASTESPSRRIRRVNAVLSVLLWPLRLLGRGGSSGREAEALDAWAEWAREYVKVYDQTGLPPTF